MITFHLITLPMESIYFNCKMHFFCPLKKILYYLLRNLVDTFLLGYLFLKWFTGAGSYSLVTFWPSFWRPGMLEQMATTYGILSPGSSLNWTDFEIWESLKEGLTGDSKDLPLKGTLQSYYKTKIPYLLKITVDYLGTTDISSLYAGLWEW